MEPQVHESKQFAPFGQALIHGGVVDVAERKVVGICTPPDTPRLLKT